MKNRDLYTFSFYREKQGSEIGPQLETQQQFCDSNKDAIKTGKTIAKQANWRLIQIKNDTKIIFE